MGQTSISVLNKTGISMFWASMWDSKINYSKFLKQDIFLKSFLSLIFNDSLSSNLFNCSNTDKNNIKKYYHFINDNSNFKKIIFLKNKSEYFQSKVWLLRYQQWVILYNFIFISEFEKKSKKYLTKNNANIFKKNLSNIFRLYEKSNLILKKNLKI